MTYAASEVLSDAKVALNMLEIEIDEDRWRVNWAGGVALLRAVGHVLLNVDQKANVELAKISDAAHRRWRSNDPAHAVYRDFILEERNTILKEYRSKVYPRDKISVAITKNLNISEVDGVSYLHQPADLDENLFRPILEGYGEGEDARDIFEEAIEWWERELDMIDAEFIRRAIS